jgi:hypothetical protein
MDDCESKWTSRKLWLAVVAEILATAVAAALLWSFREALEARLLPAAVYRDLTQGVFYSWLVFTGADLGLYKLSNVSLDWIHNRGTK